MQKSYLYGVPLIDVKLDDIDRKIISLMQKNPKLSQNEIARMVELSQPSVSARIKRLKEKGLIACNVGVDIKRAGLHVAKIEMGKDEKIESLEVCPYILGMIETEDAKTLYIVSEDFSSLESIAKKRFGKDDIKVILSSYPNFIMPLKMNNEASCSLCQCQDCKYYINGKCLGCPLSPYYKGKLW